MTFLLGMCAASCIAFVAYLVGYGAGHTNGFHAREPETGDAFASEPLRADSIARLTPTIPPPITGKEIATALVAELDKATMASFGASGSRSKALEIV